MKKNQKILNEMCIAVLDSGERQFMFDTKIRYSNNKHYGELELVDKDLFFVCSNRRDN